MLDTIRYRIAIYYAKKAQEEICKGDFEAIMKSLEYLKKSISIVPPSQELKEFGKKMRETVELHEIKIREELSR